jgi:UrcA family protein
MISPGDASGLAFGDKRQTQPPRIDEDVAKLNTKSVRVYVVEEIDALKQINVTTRDSVTRAANVSLADLDLSTPEGSRTAHERLETMAQRLCAELARSHELAYQPSYGTCVHDTLAGALAQVNAFRAAKDTRAAQRITP